MLHGAIANTGIDQRFHDYEPWWEHTPDGNAYCNGK
jgi:hypothetical protein